MSLDGPLPVELCGVRLAGPLVLASGGLGESAGSLRSFLRPSVAAVTTRTLRLRGFEQRRVFPTPHLHLERRGRYLLNCEWGNQTGLSYWVDEGFAELSRAGVVVIASVSGRDPDDCGEVCARLPPDLVGLVEVNVSCSHAGRVFGRVEADQDRLIAATAAARSAFPRAPIVKLGWSPSVADAADAAVAAGAGAIAVTNTVGPGLDIDLRTRGPVLGLAGGLGGMSGPAIFPLALEAVAAVSRRVAVPVVGIGGVSSWREAAKMVLAGATAVGIYTAAYVRGPWVFDDTLGGLRRWMVDEGASSLGDLAGVAHRRLPVDSHLGASIPVVVDERCTPCPACRRVCPSDAIRVDTVARIDPGLCTSCGACVGACPPGRDAIRLP